MLLEHVPCDLCGSDRYRVRYTKPDNWLRNTLYQFPIVECLDCGLVYVSPRPSPESMAAFYPPGYHDNRDTAESNKRYARQKAHLPKLEGKRVLDIGCARGDFLAYLLGDASDFEAYGVDAYSDHVTDTRIRFYSDSLLNLACEAESFDLVMAWAVFEHLHHPMAYFRKAAQLLKSDGEMIILVTNSESLYGRHAYTEDVPRHTYHYSASTLEKYGQESGLRLTEICYSDDIFDGRGIGTVAYALGKLAGFTWEKEMLGKLGRPTKAALSLGALVDKVLFSSHWEASLKRSGVVVAKYAKLR